MSAGADPRAEGARWRRRAFSGLACLLAAAAPPAAADELRVESIEVTAVPVPLDPEDPERRRVGALVWRGGLELGSEDERFGGLSGLSVSPDGAQLLAVSDKGHWLSARLAYDAAGRLVGFGEAAVGRLRGLEGEALTKKKWRDAEALAAPGDGAVLVGFEREHRIWRYAAAPGARPLEATPTAWPGPDGFADVPGNKGLEALAALPGGGLLALTQDRFEAPAGDGFHWSGERWSRVTYAREEGFRTRGAARLPGGDVLVLETGDRDGAGPAARLLRLAASDLGAGAEIAVVELARLAAPIRVEKFEGVAVRVGAGGEVLVYLLSDDDFEEDQRTLLLMFELEH